MPYLVDGSAQQVAELFGTTWLVAKGDDAEGADTINKDLPRQYILGSQEQAQHLVKTWQASSNKETYCQGNITADNSHLFLGNPFLLKKEDEAFDVYQDNVVREGFAYVNSENQLAGLMIFYRKDNPAQWMLAVAEHNEFAPQERKLTLLANFDLQSYIKNPSSLATLEVVDRLNNKLIAQIKSPLIKELVINALQADNGDINSRIARVKQLLRMPAPDHNLTLQDPLDFSQIQAQQLFADNPALDLISEHKLKLSFKMLQDCLTETSGLRQEVEAVPLSATPEINKCLLKMTILFYENKVLNEYRALLQEQLFNKAAAGQIWNDAQIALMPSLIKAQYAPELLQLILSQRAYYDAVADLQVLGLTEDIPAYFANPAKLQELDLLSKVANKSMKQMCLIFWVKGSLSTEEYTQLLKAAETYPLLAATLIALDKTGEFNIKDLKEWALNPQAQLQQSIIHHFGDRFPINKTILSKLGVYALERLSRAFMVLQDKENISKGLYELVARDNQQGYLLRLFLPSFATSAPEHRSALIDLLYEGVQKGPITLGKRVALIKDEALKLEALKLQDRLLCAKEMQNLDFPNEHISFVASANNPTASKLRYVILRVEAQCKEIHERLLRENHSAAQQKSWQEAEKKYRRSLYQIAYQAINDPIFEFKKHLNIEQEKVLKIVDPEIKSWVYKCLIVIANVFITALTFALANEIKYKKTGNFWFFNQSKSGEELRALEQDLSEQIRPSKS